MDPSVSAVVHASRSLYFKEEKDFAEFYKSSLLYLAFISSDALPESVRLVRAWYTLLRAALDTSSLQVSASWKCCLRRLHAGTYALWSLPCQFD